MFGVNCISTAIRVKRVGGFIFQVLVIWAWGIWWMSMMLVFLLFG